MDNLEIAYNAEKSWSEANVTNSECYGGAGTGGFLLAAHDNTAAQAASKKEQRHPKEHALRGNDIDDSVVSLCAMN